MKLNTIKDNTCLMFQNYEDDTHVFDISVKNENNEVDFVMHLDVDGFCMTLNQKELKTLVEFLQKQLV
jgi:hypothetical protein